MFIYSRLIHPCWIKVNKAECVYVLFAFFKKININIIFNSIFNFKKNSLQASPHTFMTMYLLFLHDNSGQNAYMTHWNFFILWNMRWMENRFGSWNRSASSKGGVIVGPSCFMNRIGNWKKSSGLQVGFWMCDIVSGNASLYNIIQARSAPAWTFSLRIVWEGTWWNALVAAMCKRIHLYDCKMISCFGGTSMVMHRERVCCIFHRSPIE